MKLSKIKTLCAAVGIACGTIAAPSAQAITFTNTPYIGFIDIDIFGFDSGTTGYAPTGFDPFGPAAQSGVSCSTVAGCDGVAGSPAVSGIGSEDTWGVIRVNRIQDIAANDLWVASATEQLYGMFYGFADKVVEWSTSNGGGVFNFKTWSTGGTVKLWEHGAVISDFGDVLGGSAGPLNRTAADGYLGNGTTQLNNGTPWLVLTAAPGQSEYAGTTLESGFSSTNASGSSDFYADVSGGTAASLFYDAQPDENGVNRDFYIRNVNTLSGRGTWTVRADTASSSAAAIPEPGSMALVGLGLMGLAGLRRRKQQA